MFQGKDYPVKSTIDGNPYPDVDAVTLRKIDDCMYEGTAKPRGQT